MRVIIARNTTQISLALYSLSLVYGGPFVPIKALLC